MAQVKFSDLAETTTANDQMELVVEDAGIAKRIQRSNFVDGLASSGTASSGGGGTVEMVASGALTTGDAVIVTPGGEVSKVSVSATSVDVAIEQTDLTLPESSTWIHTSVYDPVNDQSIVIYTVSSEAVGRYTPGELLDIRSAIFTSTIGDVMVSGSTELVSLTGFLNASRIQYDNDVLDSHSIKGKISACVVNNKIIIWYMSNGGARYQVGSLSPGAVSWSPSETFQSGAECVFDNEGAFYDSVNNRVVIGFGEYLAGELTGSGMTQGSLTWFNVTRKNIDAGQRTIGIYSFDGATLTLDGDLYQPRHDDYIEFPTTGQVSFNLPRLIGAVHGYSDQVSWINGGNVLETPVDAYFVTFDGFIYKGYMNTAGVREWSHEYSGVGGWMTQEPHGAAVSPYSYRSHFYVQQSSMAWFAPTATLLVDRWHSRPVSTNYFEYDTIHHGLLSAYDNTYSCPATDLTDGGLTMLAGTEAYSQLRPVFAQVVFDPMRGRYAVLHSDVNAIEGQVMLRTMKARMNDFRTDDVPLSTNLIVELVDTYNATGDGFTNSMTGGASGHYDATNDAIVWFSSDGDGINAYVHRTGGLVDAANLSADNFLGFSSADYADGATALILTVGSIDTSHSGMTPATRMWVTPDGDISDETQLGEVFAGTALTATKLLVRA
jgi:hypothetical protein